MLTSHDILATAAKARSNRSGKSLGSFDGCALGVARFSEHPLWERHPAGDEMLQVIEGELDLTVLTGTGPVEMTLRPGSVFVVPRGLWHSPRPRGLVTLMHLSNAEGSEVSNKKDPRASKKRTRRP